MRTETATIRTARCCSSLHKGERVLPESFFFPSSLKRGKSAYCRACYKEWKARKLAATRGEVAAETGTDFTAVAEARLFPGRPYHSLTRRERDAAIALARDLACQAGLLLMGADQSGEAVHG